MKLYLIDLDYNALIYKVISNLKKLQNMKYSGFKVLWEGLKGNTGWKPLWRKPDPKKNYDIIIIGGGGHGLATAYYLAEKFNLSLIHI